MAGARGRTICLRMAFGNRAVAPYMYIHTHTSIAPGGQRVCVLAGIHYSTNHTLSKNRQQILVLRNANWGHHLIHEPGLEEAHEIHGHIERYGDEGVEEQCVVQELREEYPRQPGRPRRVFQLEVPLVFVVLYKTRATVIRAKRGGEGEWSWR